MTVIVVGAGVFGAWSAKYLADAGHHVILIDAYGPANGRASSTDHSRVIRAGYGADALYSRWATTAWRDWEWLSAASAQPLVVRTGALFLGALGDAYVQNTYATLTGLGLAASLLSPVALHQRYPQIAVDDLGDAVLEEHAGVIRARAAVQALVRLLVASAGVEYVSERIEAVDEQAPLLRVRGRNGRALEADAFVFACGPWLPAMFPNAVGGRIRATKQEVLYFGPPAHAIEYSAAALPVWIDFPAGVYGIPDVDGHGFKIGIDRHGAAVDPDTLERTIDAGAVDAARQAVARRFPALGHAPLVEGRVCQYENTASGDFLIDRHPMWPHCWIVGGGSGHGFKHGPAVGAHVAALVAGSATVEARFAWASKSTVAARVVY